MKFAHEYEAALKQEGYPDRWVQSAISYRQLKKCIKKVEMELSRIGLDSETLGQLWQSLKKFNTSGAPFQYKFEGNLTTFVPKLVFLVNPRNGVPVDACLSPETRAYLQSLATKTCDTAGATAQILDDHPDLIPIDVNAETTSKVLGQTKVGIGFEPSCSPLDPIEDVYRRVEVPLRYDSEFFHMLNVELSGLHDLQAQQRAELTKEICGLGQSISKIAAPSQDSAKSDLYAWREIFSLYTDSKIFFSTNEQDEFCRDSSTAQKQLQEFSAKLCKLKATKTFRRKESYKALKLFLQINLTMLRNLKFQELNATAMTKILKKFDKRTALGARNALPDLISTELLSSQSLAKSLCFKISEEVLTVIPQLNDYLCPVCFNISFKPIRLRCGHVFCIRCMIVMQRAKEDHCPLCRGPVVMQADSTNLDPALTNFLRTFFPREVKLKQKENERDSGIDQYGEDYTKCTIM